MKEFYSFAAERMNDMPNEESAKLVAKGLEALANDHDYLALTCFEQAIRLEWTPLACSSLAFCMAKVRGKYLEATQLARKALDTEPENPAHYKNLGRILLLAGDNEQGIDMLRQGLKYGEQLSIVQELENLGIRKTPIFKSLPRSHPFNKNLGLFLKWIGLR
jgi:tetratricopeptide (TPR) repeat protein